MSIVIAIAQHKGGTGKTTSTINIGAALARNKKRVLLVDLDPQANLSQSLGVMDAEQNIYGVIEGGYKAADAVMSIHESLDLIPAHLDLVAAEISLLNRTYKEQVLKKALQSIKDNYDFILIDCPPSIGQLTFNAFTAADYIVIPLQAQYLAMQGIKKLIEAIGRIQEERPELKIGGVFVTQYDNRKVLNRSVLETIGETFGSQVFKTVIRDNVALAEAPVSGVDVFRYAPKSKGAEDYEALTKEILKACK